MCLAAGVGCLPLNFTSWCSLNGDCFRSCSGFELLARVGSKILTSQNQNVNEAWESKGHASFEEAIGKAVYPPAAWYFRPTAKGAGGRAAPQSALVWPLAEVIDETYSVYFDLAG